MAATQSACTRRGRLKAVELGAHGERTRNMYPIFVMLDVSKLSGWLNALVLCQVERRGVRCGAEVWAEGKRSVGRRQRTSGMHGERARL